MNILFAGGGTAGHINPALAVAGYAKRADKSTNILFIGTQKGLEKSLVPKSGFDIEYVEVEGFKRKQIFANFKVLFKLFKSQGQVKKILKEFKPDVILATGGYVSGPVVTMAHKLKIPVVIHEQNVYPGLTVKASVKYVDNVLVSFDETVNYIKQPEKCIITGNPIRCEITEANYHVNRALLRLEEKPLVLVFGGSLGAKRLNDTMIEVLKLFKDDDSLQIIFSTGERNFDEVVSNVDINMKNVKIVPYIHNMHEIMSACDIVVSRAGAITVSEIAALNKPCILIPSPNVVRNHQEQNARALEKCGGAIVVTEDELTGQDLYNEIKKLSQDTIKRANMATSLNSIAKIDATEKIYQVMMDLIK